MVKLTVIGHIKLKCGLTEIAWSVGEIKNIQSHQFRRAVVFNSLIEWVVPHNSFTSVFLVILCSVANLCLNFLYFYVKIPVFPTNSFCSLLYRKVTNTKRWLAFGVIQPAPYLPNLPFIFFFTEIMTVHVPCEQNHQHLRGQQTDPWK